jgi:pimeloyl-ACP methyl ester carboxylesterase
MQPVLKEFFSPFDHRLAYTEWGDPANERVLFCVHGLTRNGRDFDHLAKALAEKYRVICPDVIGRGRSDWLDDPADYVYELYIHHMLQLIEHLGKKEVSWLGTSMGGLIGMLLASYKPDLISRLILNDVGPFIPREALERIAKYVGITKEFANIEEVEQYLRIALAPFGITKDEDWLELTLHSIYVREDDAICLNYDPAIAENFKTNIQDVNLWKLWEEIKIPTLILRGQNSDILSAETARTMVETKSAEQVKLVEFPGVGHAPALFDEAQISVIKNWLS